MMLSPVPAELIGIKLINPKQFISIYKVGWDQFMPFVITIVAMYFTDLLTGVGIGLGIAILWILYRNFKQDYFLKDNDKSTDEVHLILSQHATFLNKANILQRLTDIPDNKKVIIDLSKTIDIDYDIKEVILEFSTNAIDRNIEVEIIDKHKIANKIKTPKIVLSGGSNLAFGIDSEMLSNNFEIPVINLGLHGGLGLPFILEETKSVIKKGDIVILSIEYFLVGDGDYDLMKKTSSFYPPAKKFYSHNYYVDFKNHLKKTEKTFKHLINKKDKTIIKNSDSIIKIYRRDGFNKYGDLESHLNQSASKNLKSRIFFDYKYWEGIDLINKFYFYANDKGVKVYFTYPAYAESEYKKNFSVISKLEKDLNNNLKIEVLNTPKDFVYPDKYFFDSVFHLNKKGRIKRTKKMISLITNNEHLLLYLDSIK